MRRLTRSGRTFSLVKQSGQDDEVQEYYVVDDEVEDDDVEDDDVEEDEDETDTEDEVEDDDGPGYLEQVAGWEQVEQGCQEQVEQVCLERGLAGPADALAPPLEAGDVAALTGVAAENEAESEHHQGCAFSQAHSRTSAAYGNGSCRLL
eukprot:s815_g30.t1